MFLGPSNGTFKEVIIRSMHNTIREEITEIHSGLQGCFAIKFTNPKDIIERRQLKKGMVLIDSLDTWKNNIVKQFWAKITILKHSTTIRNGYSPVIHCCPIRQCAEIILDTDKQLRIGDTAMVQFKFLYHPEFLEENMVFFFREGATKGIGEVISLNN